jgi:hypothetical protein
MLKIIDPQAAQLSGNFLVIVGLVDPVGEKSVECGQLVGGQLLAVVHQVVHMSRRARADPKDSSMSPQAIDGKRVMPDDHMFMLG